MTCPTCGTAAPDEARFCPTCGQALVNRPDERRVATVLFADLVGFTSYSEAADPEHVKHLVDTCFEALGAEVTAFGGQVDKIVGDAMVALFGAPVAHEDDAERAVRCALQMQRILAEIRERDELVIEMRVGVNTGEVLVGALRAGGDYTAMGDVVNIASRLQSAALPGQVLVGPTTHAATQHAVRYDALGMLTVKGREERVDAFVAVEPIARPGTSRKRLRASLIGRDIEVTLLRGIVDAALARDHAHLVLLTGDAGVGKSRLAGEVAKHAGDERRAIVLSGQCVPYGEDVWWPIAETIRAVCDVPLEASHDEARAQVTDVVAHATERPIDDAEVGRVTRGLLYLLGFQDELADVDPGRARDDALRSARSLYGFLASKRPLVIVLSDVHWADDLVLELMDRMLEWLRSRPFVLVATARPELGERWRPEPGRHDLSVLNLEPLGAESVQELVSELLGADATPELVAVLHERSGGNPFFIEELAALIRESGGTPDAGARRLPATLQGLVAARLDTLSAVDRNVLEDCAVVGTSGSVEAVRALVEARGDGTNTRQALDRLADRELVELGGGEYTFPSEVVRDVAYGTLTKGERARRHAVLGEWLAERDDVDESPAALERVAHHYGVAAELVRELGAVSGVSASLPIRAIEVLERAADRARGAELWKSAARLSEQALTILPHDAAPETRWNLLLGRGRALAEQRELAAAREDAEEVLEGGSRDPRTEARALSLLADIEQMGGNHDTAVEIFGRALDLWRELGDEQGMAGALRGRGLTAMFEGDLDTADSHFTEALAAYRRVKDLRGEAWALQNLSMISFFRGDADGAEQRLAAAGEMFHDLSDWGGLNWSFALLAWVRFMQGRLEEAEQLAREQIAESEVSGNRWVTGILAVLIGNVSLWSGRPDAAVECARDAIAQFGAIGDSWGETQARVVLVRALAAAGRVDDAIAELDGTALGRAGVPLLSMSGNVRDLVRAQVLVHAGDLDGLAAALHVRGNSDHAYTLGVEVRMMLGLALLQAGRTDEALVELEGSRAQVIDLDTGPGAAARSALALALAAAGESERARELAQQGAGKGTYLDQQGCAIGGAFALLQLGDPGAVDAFDALLAAVDETDARLDQAIVRLARARAWAVLGRDDAEAVESDAQCSTASLGRDLAGWDRVFTLAATPKGAVRV
jgi:class 3 adenylate cyclase/tetratricopeptide (TPR) repeat protein